ncbi:endonuclease/exonuclease/phosphatase family protein [Herbiconiux sp. CPCC 203407]|uniref:Endonuclease/exonuclease/phosphatase family protein n=1 Tax=Herbiconiux oxytropis TaxID=2970915 RepID=A0AA42BSZ4_9MICO|nr:endonuclease/exonuclease/phosphatase family protein [Herbiconiux oxytropis]MCS5721019.1 endonuclease/exonuclease/phosphatase family protein [Herbiconiux oxytropis]MCS5724671.1 endonuclease/exonuclease/phosphatase family protein [Herbiconiux oxytropis]
MSAPGLLGLQRQLVFAQLIAFRGLLALGFAVLGLVGALLFWLLRGRARTARPVVAGLAAIALLAAGAHVVVQAGRGFGSGARPETAARSAEGESRSARPGAVSTDPATSIRILTWNTYDTVTADEIARVALAQGSTVLTLPETSRSTAESVARVMDASGQPMQVFTAERGDPSDVPPTAMLVSEGLGDYEVTGELGDTGTMPSIVARPADGTGPVLVAAHPMPPLPSIMTSWRSDLGWVLSLCDEPDLVLGGDLNATLDHLGPLGGCSDALGEAGAGAQGSWPTSLPPLLGAPIDHVLMTGDWRADASEVLSAEDSAGSDHRPVVATLLIRG